MTTLQGRGPLDMAREALRRGDARSALATLEAMEPRLVRPEHHLERALCLKVLGRLDEAIVAYGDVLVLDPKNFVALLSRAAILEQLGREAAAAGSYRAALAVAPPASMLPPAAAQALSAAAAFVQRANQQLAEHLSREVADVRAAHADADLERFDESLAIFAGVAKPQVQKPLLLHYPRLPAIPFYDRALFPWLGRLEAATAEIQAELAGLDAAALDAYAPYIQMPPGVPVDQWRELNHSARWSSVFLWLEGERQERICELCPRTAALLAELPMTQQPGFAPNAMFSRLAPRTSIPPHTGSTNTRLVVHLPLVLPGKAWFRVGNVTREWRLGEAWVFDDTLEHEAMNEADAPRTVLIFDVWNPFLSEAERELVSAMMSARRAYEEAEVVGAG